jgi:hypothetical protein
VDFGNGHVEKLTRSQIVELKQNGLRQADYTRKTQELAQQRQQADQALQMQQQYEMQLAQARAILSNPHLMRQEADRQLAAQQPIDPNQPLTMAHAQQLTQRIGQVLQNAENQAIERAHTIEQNAQRYVEDRIITANYGEAINATLAQVKAANPILSTIPELEDVIRYRVAQLEPASIEEAQQHFQTIGGEIARGLQAQAEARFQQQVATRATLAATATEPAGGGAPQPSPIKFNLPTGKIDWNALKDAAKQMGSV